MARVHGQLVAVLHRAADLVDVGEVQPGRHTLRVEVEGDVDDVQVAGALAVAEEAAFEAIGPRHERELTRRRAGAPIVVRVHRQHDGLAPSQVPMHPLDHVGEDVGRAVLHRGGQVDDALALGRGRPDRGDRVDHPLGEGEFGA